VRQSRFEGSHRQKRAELVRILLDRRATGDATLAELTRDLSDVERSAGRDALSEDVVEALLLELEREGFCRRNNGAWRA
jgi:A/G-specific adenine glycosylase